MKGFAFEATCNRSVYLWAN